MFCVCPFLEEFVNQYARSSFLRAFYTLPGGVTRAAFWEQRSAYECLEFGALGADNVLILQGVLLTLQVIPARAERIAAIPRPDTQPSVDFLERGNTF